MNFKKKMRRGSLAALITLALTSSALAMPTGGVVQSGDVNIGGSTDFSSVASGATIWATTDSVINWATFGIGNGETLNFDVLAGKTLLNQVTGAQVSDILGTMRQTGGGEIALVNPNGIHIGDHAVLNVQDVTLSALSLAKADDRERVLRETGNNAFVNIDHGAEFNVAYELNVFAGRVNVADGVVFNMGYPNATQDPMLQIKAANSATWTMRNGDSVTENLVHNTGNDVIFNGTVNLYGGSQQDVEIGGAKVTATGAKFLGDKVETTLYAASKFSGDERDASHDNHRYVAEATAENTLTADTIEATGKNLSLGGGVTTLKNSHNINVGSLSIDGAAKIVTKGIDKRIETLTAPDRTVTISNSQLKADEVGIYGGKVTVDSNVTFGKLFEAGKFEVVAGNVYHDQYRYTTVAGNELAFHGKVNDFAKKADTDVLLLGNTVNLDGAQMRHVGQVNIGALNVVDEKTIQATAANTLIANGANIQSDTSAYLHGGTVTLTNTTIDVANEINLYTGIDRDLEGKGYAITTAPDQKVTFAGTGTYKATSVDVRGGKVTVESGITFAAKDPAHERGLDIVAGSEQVSSDGKTRTYTHNKGNDLAFHGKSENFGKTENEPVALLGSTVNLDGARIEGARYVNAAAAQRIVSTDGENGGARVTASAGNALSADGAQITGSKDVYLAGGNIALKGGEVEADNAVNIVAVRDFATNGNSAAAGKDHVIYLDGAKIKGKDITTLSGKVQMVNDTKLEGTNDASLYIGNSFSKTADDKIVTYATKENTLDMRRSKVTAPVVGFSAGGAGIFDHSTVEGTTKLKDTELHLPSSSEYVGYRDTTSRVTSGGLDEAGFTVKDAADVPPTPEKPVPPVAPDTIAPAETPLSAQDKENVETGKTKAQEALAASTQEQRAEALTKTVAQLNEKVGTSRRQTAGVVVGIVQEIANAATLSDGEKVALVESVLNAYAPVQEAKAEQDNTATNTLDEAVSAATNVSVAPVYPDETEAEDVVSFA